MVCYYIDIYDEYMEIDDVHESLIISPQRRTDADNSVSPTEMHNDHHQDAKYSKERSDQRKSIEAHELATLSLVGNHLLQVGL